MNSDPEDHVIDLTIEALTGTVYDLCVSPFETILGIKTKIQRLEGIPVYQQHLIFGGIELQDDFCLEEYGIRSGSQLKLITAMRGGPVHAHRIQLEDSALWELAEFLDTQSLDDADQYTVMLLSDNVDLLEDRSHVHSPVEISDSRTSNSQTSVVTTQQPKSACLTAVENAITQEKMRDIQDRLRQLRLNRIQNHTHQDATEVKRKRTAKVIVLNSRASSRLPTNSSATPPQSCAHCCNTHHCTCSCGHHCCHCHVVSTQRKLVFQPSSTHDSSGMECSSRMTTSYAGTSYTNQPPPSEDMTFCGASRRQPSASEPRRRKFRRGHTSEKALKRECSTDTMTTGRLSREGVDGETSTYSTLSGALHHGTGVAGIKQQHAARRLSSRGHFLPSIVSSRSSQRVQPWSSKGPSSPVHLPPIKKIQATSQRSRCMHCNKRTKLATSYTCRCGGTYCAAHRYAEKHSCTFDYKSEGRDLITRNNPLVTAPKLPKI